MKCQFDVTVHWLVRSTLKIMNARLLNYLEANHLLGDSQSGLNKLKRTDDQVTYLAQDIEDAFQEREKVLATFFDLTKAFDKVCKERLLLKLTRMEIQGNVQLDPKHPDQKTCKSQARWQKKQTGSLTRRCSTRRSNMPYFIYHLHQ